MDIAKLRKKAGKTANKKKAQKPDPVVPSTEEPIVEEEWVVDEDEFAAELVEPEEETSSLRAEKREDELSLGEAASGIVADTRVEYLSFVAAGEPYAFRIARVVEIIKPREISAVPRSERHICGILSLRGQMIPVLDLMVRLDLRSSGYLDGTISEQPRIIILAQGEAKIGLFVDAVSGVVYLDEELFEDAANVQGARDHRFVRAIGKVDDGFVIVLDIDEIFSEGEL